MSGKVAVYFDFDFDINPLDGNANPIETARIRFQTVEAIDGDFNIEIKSTAAVSISCSFPGSCSGAKDPKKGDKFKSPRRQDGKKVRVAC